MNALGALIVAGIIVAALSWGLDVFNRFQSHKIVEKLLKNSEKRDPRALENAEYGRLTGDAAGLTIKTAKGQSATLSCTNVVEIHAFKRDLGTTDLICLAFKTGKDEFYEINEEMAGYHDLLELIPKHFPEFHREWFSSVAFPAFAANHQVIWRRLNQL